MEPYASPEETSKFTTELEGLLHEPSSADRASSGVRFANYIIDRFVIFLIFFVFLVIIALATHLFDNGSNPNAALVLLIYLLLFGTWIGYYTLFEATSGRTLGKLLTSTKVVKENGDAISLKDALLRTLCRMVPFEPFSGFGTPWHDAWTHTTVIVIRRRYKVSAP